jgi:hypothetical protein
MRLLDGLAHVGGVFDRAELAALKSAGENGWLTLTPAIGDQALAAWRHECERSGKAFAVLRLEAKLASLWFLLTTEREWTQPEQARILAALANTIGYVVTSNKARAFTRLGVEDDVMQTLIAANTVVH